MNIWEELGIAETQDSVAIRRAYAVRVRKVNPEADPKGFQRLRAAYEEALSNRSALSPTPATTAPIADGTSASPESVAAATPAQTSTLPTPLLYQSIIGLVERLKSAAAADRSRLFNESLQQEGWEGLDFQTRLQRALSRLLLTHFDQLDAVIPAVASGFGWTDAGRKGAPSDPVVREIVARLGARQWRAVIEQLPGRGPRIRDALNLLRGPVDPTRFGYFKDSEKNLIAMHELLKELHGEQQAALRYDVNGDSVQWWIQEIERRKKLKADKAMAPPRQSSGLPPWTIIILIMVAVQVSRLFTGASNEKPRAYLPEPHVTPSSPPPVPLMLRPPPAPPPSTMVDANAPMTPKFEGPWSTDKIYFRGSVVSYRGRKWISRETIPAGDLAPDLSFKWKKTR